MCINICRTIDPQIIIFGGGLAKAGNVLIDLVNKHIKHRTWTVLPTYAKLCLSKSENAGVVGAALAAQNKFKKHQVGNATIRDHNMEIDKNAFTEECDRLNWVGPIITTTSAIVLALSLQQGEQPTSRSLLSTKNILLLGQIGLGIGLTYCAKRK